MRPIAILLLLASTANATILSPGFQLNVLTPTLPGTSTTSTVAARNPLDGSLWMSNGHNVYKLDGAGGVTSSESIRSIDGGPVTGLSTDLAFDAAGTMYVTDFAQHNIYRRPISGAWSIFATVNRPRSMEFDTLGNLITLGGNNDGTTLGFASSISPMGVVSTIGVTAGESFVLDPSTGDMLIPHYDGTGIDRLTMGGVLTTEFNWDRPIPILYEAIALTAGGNFIIGVNLGADETETFNRSQIIRVNGVNGLREVIGEDIIQGVIPVDMILPGDLIVSGFGSLVGFELVGDLDADLNIPEPSTGLLVLCGLFLQGIRRRKSLRR